MGGDREREKEEGGGSSSSSRVSSTSWRQRQRTTVRQGMVGKGAVYLAMKDRQILSEKKLKLKVIQGCTTKHTTSFSRYSPTNQRRPPSAVTGYTS